MFKITRDEFMFNNEPEYLVCAEIHYFRLDKINWENVVDKAIEAGCNVIAFYVPWYIHEYEEGKFDFTGLKSENYDLVSWLELLKQKNVKMFFRPGPYVYAEMKNLGLPDWLVEKYGENTIHTYNNELELEQSQFNFAFAHNNTVFKKFVELYLIETIKIVLPYKDDIILVQICNEIPGLDIDDHSFENDSSKYLLNYIIDNYTLEEFNNLFDLTLTSIDDFNLKLIVNHRNYKNFHLEYYYGEYYVQYFQFLISIYKRCGIDSNFIHNAYNPRAISLFKIIKEKIPELIIGVDNYYSLQGSFDDKSAAYYCEFGVSYIKNIMKNVPFVVEHETGFWYDYPKVTGEELALFTSWSFIYGYKGINMYLFHEGVNKNGMGFNATKHEWQALVDKKGVENFKYDCIKNDILDIISDKVLIQEEVAYDCAMSFEHFPGLIWHSLSKKTEDFYHLLFKANHQPEIIDIDVLTIDELKKYKLIYFLVDRNLSSKLQKKLIEMIKENVNLVIVGNLPTSDWYYNDTQLIDYLNIKIKHSKSDSFSQTINLSGEVILYDVDNLDILETNFKKISSTNYDVPVLLYQQNLFILNGFLSYKMKSQLDIIKHIDQVFNVEHYNYGCDLRVVKKTNGVNYIFNPFSTNITERLVIYGIESEYFVPRFGYIRVDNNE